MTGVYVRILVIVLVVLVVHFSRSNYWLRHSGSQAQTPFDNDFFSSMTVRTIGVALCVCGVALAVWARTHLGRNWGMPMSFKENPELVTTGPYVYIRNPIYTGFLLAILGSSLTGGPIWLIFFVVFSAYFTYCAKKEEKIMTQEFPDTYPDYKRRTRMLIPFVV
ncbi:MAG: isoprenylcysteine carboxylmethyltransferase family protein [Gemmatimonadaceae bacterium]